MVVTILLIAIIGLFAVEIWLKLRAAKHESENEPQSVQSAYQELEKVKDEYSVAKRLAPTNNRRANRGRNWQYIVMPSGRTRRIYHAHA